MSEEVSLLNSLLTSRDLSPLSRHGLHDDSAWPTQLDSYRFIVKHEALYGELPSVESVVAACPGFEFRDATESADTLCAKLIERNTKNSLRSVLLSVTGERGEVWSKHTSSELLQMLDERVQLLREQANARRDDDVVDWSHDTEWRQQEYDKRASGEYGSAIPLFGPEVDDAVSGFHRGDFVTLCAKTKRGKSWMAELAGLIANNAGFRVLGEFAESTKPEVGFRLDTLSFGVSNRGLWGGSLDSTGYRTYIRKLDELRRQERPSYIIRVPEHWPNGLTIAQIEADIDRFKPDVVIIDQFSLIEFRGDDQRSVRRASKQLKLLFARKGVVGIVVTQANGEFVKRDSRRRDEDDDPQELRPPSEADYSETIGVIQDCTHLVAFDSIQWLDGDKERGKAQLIVRLSRTGGAGTTVDYEWLPNDGVIRPRQPIDYF